MIPVSEVGLIAKAHGASPNIQVAQYDTIHAYDEVARASHAVAHWLERKGYGAVAVPAFIPIDMSPPKHGMRGAVDWRGAGRSTSESAET